KTLDMIQARYQQLQSRNGRSVLTSMEQNAYDAFNKLGVPTVKQEEWKYTRIGSVLNKDQNWSYGQEPNALSQTELAGIRLPGHEQANELVFVNGRYMAGLSSIRSKELIVQSLEEAAHNEYKDIVSTHLGHSGRYLKDGMHALNTAFVQEGVYIHIPKGRIMEHPVYVYYITDARVDNILSQPRILLYAGEAAQVRIVETYHTVGQAEGFTNQVMEVIVEKEAVVDYYKIQNDATHTHQVSTTHFRQIGKSTINSLTISLNGGIIRNNLNIVLEAEHCESHLHGIYFLKGQTHVDNHTTVDNVKPHCQSNELYKGVMDDASTAVFNGKIFVQPQAQKTNAFQSNKNILLSDNASVNTKPQLEIFADDVKCSHGCTVGQLDEEGMFYLRSRGVPEKIAKSLLVQAFAFDVLELIRLDVIRDYVEQLIAQRLEFKEA
ncbi:MAG TPA: Fe-S cluster assembly protein SufD, partial [Flavisolibacter sp.]|nr:Fe-S cluster assembly protein SufD [Flavisolibacter sp.]